MLELNSGPLKEQLVLLTVESSFQPSQVSFEEQKFIILKFSFFVCMLYMHVYMFMFMHVYDT